MDKWVLGEVDLALGEQIPAHLLQLIDPTSRNVQVQVVTSFFLRAEHPTRSCYPRLLTLLDIGQLLGDPEGAILLNQVSTEVEQLQGMHLV